VVILSQGVREVVKISVVIPAYNAEAFIAAAIESCLRQNPGPHEVIVVDDASSDRTVEIAKSYPPPVRVICVDRNRGVSHARNLGAQEATGDWIALLDADDWFLPEKFEGQIRCMAQNPDAKFIYSGFRTEGANGTQEFPALPVRKIESELRYRVPFGLSSVMVRRDAFLELGGFDTTLRYADDWDFHLRFAARFSTGAFACAPEILSVYRLHQVSKGRNTIPVYEARKLVMNGPCLHGLSGFSRHLWWRKINSFNLYDLSIVLRENDSPRDLEFIVRSLLFWPFPSETIPIRRYLIAAVMLKQHVEKRVRK
jgi:glycosyltransferase involved in cell wall biosynthesis